MTIAEEILAASDTSLQPVTAWGKSLFVKNMTGTERDSFETAIMKDGKVNTEMFRAKLVVRTLVDAEGKRVFTDEQTAALSAKSAAEIDKVFTVAQKLNGLSPTDVDELTKNS